MHLMRFKWRLLGLFAPPVIVGGVWLVPGEFEPGKHAVVATLLAITGFILGRILDHKQSRLNTVQFELNGQKAKHTMEARMDQNGKITDFVLGRQKNLLLLREDLDDEQILSYIKEKYIPWKHRELDETLKKLLVYLKARLKKR